MRLRSQLGSSGPRPAGVIGALCLGAALLAAGGCGKKGPPRPPEPRGPRSAEAVRVRQIGEEVVAWFEVPEVRGSHPGQRVVRAELVRVDYDAGFTPPPDRDVFRRRGVIVGALEEDAVPEPGARVVMPDRDLDALPDRGQGARLRYGVRLFDVRGRESPLVVAADLLPLPPLSPPERLSAEATGDGIRLTWDAPPLPPEPSQEQPGAGEEEAASTGEAGAQEGARDDAARSGEPAPASGEGPQAAPAAPVRKYNVYRSATDGPAAEDPINSIPVTSTEYLDTDTREGERYRYEVRLLLADKAPRRESASSAPVMVLAEDRIAPAAPTGLVAVQEGGAVRLFWTPNSERDVAGYRVYRRVDDGEPVRVGPDPVEQPTWVDREVAVGQRLEYRVAAVDRASPRNEGPPSEPVELELVAEPGGPGGAR